MPAPGEILSEVREDDRDEQDEPSLLKLSLATVSCVRCPREFNNNPCIISHNRLNLRTGPATIQLNIHVSLFTGVVKFISCLPYYRGQINPNVN